MLIRSEPQIDERGYFARIWCQREFSDQGASDTMVQASLSFNRTAGTVRGLHYALAPSHESKLVRCVRGARIIV